MRQESDRGFWSAILQLRPGAYRYRYYVDHGDGHMTVCPPSERESRYGNGVQSDGWDAIFEVPMCVGDVAAY